MVAVRSQAFATKAIMEPTYKTTIPVPLAQLGLDDEQMLHAAAYIQTAEKLAVFRYHVLGYNVLLLLAAGLSASVLADETAALRGVRTLFSMIANVLSVVAVTTLLATLIGDFLLNRQLAASALPNEAKRYLRHLGSGMNSHVFRRFCRSVKQWFRRR